MQVRNTKRGPTTLTLMKELFLLHFLKNNNKKKFENNYFYSSDF